MNNNKRRPINRFLSDDNKKKLLNTLTRRKRTEEELLQYLKNLNKLSDDEFTIDDLIKSIKNKATEKSRDLEIYTQETELEKEIKRKEIITLIDELEILCKYRNKRESENL